MTDPTLDRRIDAIGNLMRSAGRDEQHVSSIQELARLSAERKAFEKQAEEAWSPDTDPDVQRELWMRNNPDNRDLAAVDSYVELIKSGGIENFSQIPSNIRNQVVARANEMNVEFENKKLIQDAQALSGSLQKLKDLAKEVTVFSRVNPFGSGVARFNLVKGLLGQTIAKLYEDGRLTDSDRLFYQDKIMQISPYGPQRRKEEILDEIQEEVFKKIGYTESLPERPIDLGVDKIRTNLKHSGYSDHMIDEFLKSEGLL